LSFSRLLAALGAFAASLALCPSALAAEVHCGETITQDTTLDSNLVDCPGDGIVIGADGVTLDLNGHTLDGRGGGTGVSASGRRDVEVKRGAIQGFADGVTLAGVERGAVRRIAFGGNSISCNFSEGCAIEGNVVYGAGIFTVNTRAGAPSVIRHNVVRGAGGAGITVNFTAGETTVAKNVVEESEAGIEALHASVGEISDNTIRWNAGAGIVGSLGGDSVIERNLIWRNGGDGIDLDHLADVRIFSNVITRNSGNGIHGATLARPLIADNVVSRNRANGVLLVGLSQAHESTSFAVLSGNVATRNAIDGIALTAAARDTKLEGNRALRNGDDGIDVGSRGTTLADNAVRRNADLGIEAPAGVTDGGGNRARGNGDGAQCLNVRCK
jgi:parallel beta-helix repeat protein